MTNKHDEEVHSDRFEWSKLQLAVIQSNLAGFQTLSEAADFDPNHSGENYNPILHLAVNVPSDQADSPEALAILDIILSHPKCDPTIEAKNLNVLYVACRQPEAMLARVLAHPKITPAVLNKPCIHDFIPLQNCLIEGNMTGIKQLLAAGASGNAKGSHNQNALETALDDRNLTQYLANNHALFEQAVSLLAPHTKMPLSFSQDQIADKETRVKEILAKHEVTLKKSERKIISTPKERKQNVTITDLTYKTAATNKNRFEITIPLLDKEKPIEHRERASRIIGELCNKFGDQINVTPKTKPHGSNPKRYITSKEDSEAAKYFTELASKQAKGSAAIRG